MCLAQAIKNTILNHYEAFAQCGERYQDEAKTGEKAAFTDVNELFESVFNEVLASAVIVQNLIIAH